MKGDGNGAKVRRAEGCRWAMGQAWCPTQDHGELQPCQASLQTSAGQTDRPPPTFDAQTGDPSREDEENCDE